MTAVAAAGTADEVPTFRKFCEDSSAHGLRKIVDEKSKKGKWFWGFILLCAVVALGVHLHARFRDFLRFRHQEITYTVFQPNLSFPDVTVCNINAISASKKQLSEELKKELLEDPFDVGGKCRNVHSPTMADLNEQSPQELLILAGEERIANISHKREDLIVSCRFGSLTCDPEEFSQFTDSQYYTCQTISLNKMIKRLEESDKKGEVGADNGLSLILYLEATDGSHNGLDGNMGDPYIVDSKTRNTAGARVAVHKAGTKARMRDFGVDVAVGFSTSIALQPYIFTRLAKPYATNCTDREMIADTNLIYTQSDCYDFCLQEKVIKQCGCYHIDFPRSGNSHAPVCGQNVCNVTDWLCLHKVAFHDDSDDCLKSCPRTCYDETFEQRMSSSYWPGDDYQYGFFQAFFADGNHALVNSTLGYPTNETLTYLYSKNLIRKNFIRVNVFMETFYARFAEEEPLYDIDMLLADFGGTFGLWAGISIITVIEVIEFCAVSCTKRMSKYIPGFSSKNRTTVVHPHTG